MSGQFNLGSLLRSIVALLVVSVSAVVVADTFPPLWDNGQGAAIHYQPVQWPDAPDASACGDDCGDWKPYTRFQNSINDPRSKDPSNGGTSPQAYVNIASSCTDTALPSVYYYLHKGTTPADDVLMFRWRVESAAHNYATGPNAGAFSSSNPWSSALWSVMFNLSGQGYTSLAAHINGSSGSPAEAIDVLTGIWSNTTNHSLDYVNNPNVHNIGHNPTAFIGETGKILNFGSNLDPQESWPNGASETVWDYGTTRATLVTSRPCNEYFIDYQIPVSLLDASAIGGPKINRNTPISMLFCTANSLNNPFQKDCAINGPWTADPNNPAPFGDFVSFDRDTPIAQPIVSEIAAAAPISCADDFVLQATVKDTLALQSGGVVSSVGQVDFYYWFDSNNDGIANDPNSRWEKISQTASLKSGSLNQWETNWNPNTLPRGSYLIGVQAVDDNNVVDPTMTPSGINNRTFSYVVGRASDDAVYIDGNWIIDAQTMPAQNPAQSPSANENWWGNPQVDTQQTARLDTALNNCGVAPEVSYSVDNNQVAAGATVVLTAQISNPSSSVIELSDVSVTLPQGFSYVQGSATGSAITTGQQPSVVGNTLIWNSSAVLPAADSLTLSYAAVSSMLEGTYSSIAAVDTAVGAASSAPVNIVVAPAQLTLSLVPSAYVITANGSSALTYQISYQNPTALNLDDATVQLQLENGITYVSCAGAQSCQQANTLVSWDIGAIAPYGSGQVSAVITVPSSWSAPAVIAEAEITAVTEYAAMASANASVQVAVQGYLAPKPAAFAIEKDADQAAAGSAQQVTYTISYQNYGDLAASNVVITDELPLGVSFVSASNNGTLSGRQVSWALGTVAAQASGSVSLTVSIDNPFSGSSPIVNYATINWDGAAAPVVSDGHQLGYSGLTCSTYYFRDSVFDTGWSGQQYQATTTPAPLATDTGRSISFLATNSYQEVVSFYQDPPGDFNVVFNGTFITRMFIDRANGVGVNLQVSVYEYNDVDGRGVLIAQGETRKGGNDRSVFETTLAISNPLTYGNRLEWVFEASANNSNVVLQFNGTAPNTISGGSQFADSGSTFCVEPQAIIAIDTRVNYLVLEENQAAQLIYTVDVSNIGGQSAADIEVASVLPNATQGCEFSLDGQAWSSCSNATSHNVTIAELVSAQQTSFYLRTNAPAQSTAGDEFEFTTSAQSPTTQAVTASAVTRVEAALVGGGEPAELFVTMRSDKVAVFPTEVVTYTINVVNVGGSDATSVSLQSLLPNDDFFRFLQCDTCSNVGGTLLWSLADIAAGEMVEVQFTAEVNSTNLTVGTTEITQLAQVDSNETALTNSNEVTLRIDGNAALTADLTASPFSGLVPSDQTTFTYVLSNTGNSVAENVFVSIPLPQFLGFAGELTSSTGAARFNPVSNQVELSVASFAAGAQLQLSYNAVIGSLQAGSYQLTTTAVAGSDNTGLVSASAVVEASAAPLLQVTMETSGVNAFPAATVLEDSIGYELLVGENAGLQVGSWILVEGQVRQVTRVSDTRILVDAPTSVTAGSIVVGNIIVDINYQNIGNASADDVAIELTLPAELLFYRATPTATRAPALLSSGPLGWDVGDVDAQASGGMQVILFPTGSAGLHGLSVSAEAANAPQVDAQGHVIIGGLVVTKTSLTAEVFAGDVARYEIVVRNSLATSVSPVAVTDQLPSGFAYVIGSATVNGSALEPVFESNDDSRSQPRWGNLNVPAQGSVTIVFDVQVSTDLGAGNYQNNVVAEGPAGVGITQFDSLASTSEDIWVTALTDGLLQGTVFQERDDLSQYDPLVDLPLVDVQVQISQQPNDCSALSANCVVVTTDVNGEYSVSLPAGTWYIEPVLGTGELNSAWFQVVGASDQPVTIQAGEAIAALAGFATQLPSYTIEFVDWDGTVLKTEVVVSGSAATAPPAPSREGYSFVGWSPADFSAVTGNMTITALYQVNQYTITFDTAGGSLIAPITQDFGSTVIAPADPTRVGYTFAGWAPALPGTMPASNVTVVAQWTINSYSVSFLDWDGTVLKTEQVNHGSAATAPPAPSREGYSFVGWSQSFNVVTGALEVRALYRIVPIGEDLSLVTDENQPLTIAPAITAEADAQITLQVIEPPAHGELTSTSSGWVYQPDLDYDGYDAFTYIVNDGDISSVLYWVQIDVLPVNKVPVANDDNFTLPISPDNRYVLDVLANDTDADNDELSIIGATANIGEVSIVDGKLVYIAPANFSGVVILQYSITDGNGAVSIATVILEIVADEPINSLNLVVPDDVYIDSVELFTKVDLGVASATDAFGRAIPVSLVSGVTRFAPGRHVVYWRAVDFDGQEIIASQNVFVNPLISISKDQTVIPGERVILTAHLNGPAPEYPLVVPFTVSGDATSGDHGLVDGSFVFEQGQAVSIEFSTFDNGPLAQPRQVVVTLDEQLNVGANFVSTVTLTTGNIQPTISATVEQGDMLRQVISKNDGLVTITAYPADKNINDVLELTWTSTLFGPVAAGQQQVSFDPQQLDVGVYSVTIEVTDSGSPRLSNRTRVFLQVVDQLPELGQGDSNGNLIPDVLEGLGDRNNNGIPDYLDPFGVCDVIPERLGEGSMFAVEAEPSLCIMKGPTALQVATGALQVFEVPPQAPQAISGAGQVIDDPEANNVGGIFDMIVTAIPVAGQTIKVAIPQRFPVPEDAVYRRLINDGSEWVSFIENTTDKLWSTEGEPGFCPPPASSLWQPGLIAGYHCVQIEFTDGGVNDADGEANQEVYETGGVGVMATTNANPVAIADSVTIIWNQPAIIDVLANDSDSDGDTLTITSASVSIGTVEIVDGKLRYTPPVGYAGVITIRYAISDGKGGVAYADVTVTILANRAPIAVDDSVATDDRTPITILVLANDSDPDGDPLTVVSASAAQGQVVIISNGSLRYTPRVGYAGTDIIQYQISDGRGGSAAATVRVQLQVVETVIITNTSSKGSLSLWLLLLGLIFSVFSGAARAADTQAQDETKDHPILIAEEQHDWRFSLQVGQAKVRGNDADLIARLPAGATLLSSRWRDTSYALEIDYLLSDRWSATIGFSDLGTGVAVIQADTVDPAATHRAAAGIQPMLVKGYTLGLNFKLIRDEDYDVVFGAGLFDWEADMESRMGTSIIRLQDDGSDWFWRVAADYKLDENWRLGLTYRLFMLDDNINDFGLKLSYQF